MENYLQFDSQTEAQNHLDGLNEKDLHLSRFNSKPKVVPFKEHWRIMSMFEHDVVAMRLSTYLCENGKFEI